MFKVKGTLDGGKVFKFDAKANVLHEAAVELEQKLTELNIDPANVERVSFSARGAPEAELEIAEAKPRERKPRATGGKKRGGKARNEA